METSFTWDTHARFSGQVVPATPLILSSDSDFFIFLLSSLFIVTFLTFAMTKTIAKKFSPRRSNEMFCNRLPAML